jgi:hypothetical protein
MLLARTPFYPFPFNVFNHLPFFMRLIDGCVYVGKKIEAWEYMPAATRRVANNLLYVCGSLPLVSDNIPTCFRHQKPDAYFRHDVLQGFSFIGQYFPANRQNK